MCGMWVCGAHRMFNLIEFRAVQVHNLCIVLYNFCACLRFHPSIATVSFHLHWFCWVFSFLDSPPPFCKSFYFRRCHFQVFFLIIFNLTVNFGIARRTRERGVGRHGGRSLDFVVLWINSLIPFVRYTFFPRIRFRIVCVCVFFGDLMR